LLKRCRIQPLVSADSISNTLTDIAESSFWQNSRFFRSRTFPTVFSEGSLLNYKMPNYKMPNYKMPNYKMPNYKMPNNTIPTITVIFFNWTYCRLTFCRKDTLLTFLQYWPPPDSLPQMLDTWLG
jgi:hypothetical protein